MLKTIKIDLEGYPQFGDLRVTDSEIGKKILQGLRFSENGALETQIEEEVFRIEAFDEPFIISKIEGPIPFDGALRGSQGVEIVWQGSLPYDLPVFFKLDDLSIDEWDRFHGKASFEDSSERVLPFVFSRQAQAQFFNLIETFTDESFVLGGKEYFPPPWLTGETQLETPEYWSHRYLENEKPGWELEAPNPILVDFLPKLKLPKARIAVLGCGTGNDAAFFAQSGHLVTAFDFSDEALSRAKAKYSDLKNIQWVQQDVLKLGQQEQWLGQFDIVFEHTCYCAIPPEKRNHLVQVWRRILADRGQLLGIFFVMPKRTGPPFGGSEWEVRERLKKGFSFQFWQRSPLSVPGRMGKELLVLAQKMGQFDQR